MLSCPVLVFPLMEFASKQFPAVCLSRFINNLFRITNTIIPQCHIRFPDYIRRYSLLTVVSTSWNRCTVAACILHVTLLFPFVNIMLIV